MYVAQGSPSLKPEQLPAPRSEGPAWEVIIRQTLSQERDEHVYKLVQACRDMDEVNADPRMTAVYKEAADIALVFPFTFGPYTSLLPMPEPIEVY